jgi:hypothetical protein
MVVVDYIFGYITGVVGIFGYIQNILGIFSKCHAWQGRW